ncbi:MAG: methionyl-tRNA formyltransferase [Acidobacteriota bacterium]|jgi:methionyl-tRNA formyltransferase|nr:methionyl-tRNA formyltransferase [Acidobacteriota bacterium]
MDLKRQLMRTGILANSLPDALKIYDELKTVPGCETFILLCRATGESRGRNLGKHLARVFLKRGSLRSLGLIFSRKVFLFQKPLDHPQMLARLQKLKLDVGLHKAGVIYREPTINAFRLGILNPHIGILPRYRGRNVMEWALIEGGPVGITVFFIDSGIDTGKRIVLSEKVDISHCRSIEEAKHYLFNLDALFFRRALELLRSPRFEYQLNDEQQGRRYYVMSRLFREVVEKLIEAKS